MPHDPTMPPEPSDDIESDSTMTEETEEHDEGELQVDNISIRPAENGGYIASVSRSKVNSSDGAMPYVPSKDYAFASLADVTAFLAAEFGGEEVVGG